MSGFISSAGSKSGVIGITELDYEEGTWTPTIVRSGVTVGSYGVQIGKYRKVGDMVTVFVQITNSNVSGGSGGWTCHGFPFVNSTISGNSTPSLQGRNYMSADTADRDLRLNPGATIATLMTTSSDSSFQGNATYVIWSFTCTYLV